VRPLSKKELAVKDQAAWECADGQTIIYKGPPQDRAAPTSYTFGTLSSHQLKQFCML
jgi:centromeric protein E